MTAVPRAVALVAATLGLLACSGHQDKAVPIPPMHANQEPAVAHSVRIDFSDVVDPHTDWKAVSAHLDAAGVNTVDLDAGRVEFTAFDWTAHPETAAAPGTDHLAVAANAIHDSANGVQRDVNLVVDALVPRWIDADPSIAGVNAQGQRSQYVASASELHDGPVGDRLVDFVTALGKRYDPHQISITELMFRGYSFGADDLALYRRMTGATDWPRSSDGAIDATSASIATWRSQVLADVLARMRTRLDRLAPSSAHRIRLALDVRANWDAPAQGRSEDGGNYRVLLRGADQLIVWAYAGTVGAGPADVRALARGLTRAVGDPARLTISIGMWEGDESVDPQRPIPAAELSAEVQAAQTHGITSVSVVPQRLLTTAHWTALAGLWQPTSPSASVRTSLSRSGDRRRPPAVRRAVRHSVSLGFEDVVNPDDNWPTVRRRLAHAGINEVRLSAGRVEWTAFDWPAHPDAAADRGTDHLRQAIDQVRPTGAGRDRRIDIMIDTLIPAWIAANPSVAGKDVHGRAATYSPSASALVDGPVGERIVAYAGEVARRYRPDQVTLTELQFDDFTYGTDDLRLYRRMTGANDWPRTAAGAIDTHSASIARWRSSVIGELLGRVRHELDAVQRQTGKSTLLGTDVVVDWQHPERGRPDAGQSYDVIARSADRIVLWAYVGSEKRTAADVRRLTRALRASGVPMSRYSVSIGLWGVDDSTTYPLAPAGLRRAVRAAQTHGVVDVNVTPMSLMNPAHWRALRSAWGPAP